MADALNQTDENFKLNLVGTNQVKMPSLSIGQDNNRTYPEDHILVYSENQPLNGTFSGSISLADSNIRICILGLDIAEFLNPSSAVDRLMNCSGPSIRLNRSGVARFTVPGIPNGTYNLFVVDNNSSKALIAMPLLITQGNLTLQSPAKVMAGDVLNIKLNTTAEGNQTRIFAAIMISIKDYENASLNLMNGNGTGTKGLNYTLSIGSKSLEIDGEPSLSTDLLMKVMNLLPQNSAVGMQESKNPGADLALITDTEWPKGIYILTSAIYSPGSGLSGLKQEAVEVI